MGSFGLSFHHVFGGVQVPERGPQGAASFDGRLRCHADVTCACRRVLDRDAEVRVTHDGVELPRDVEHRILRQVGRLASIVEGKARACVIASLDLEHSGVAF